MCDLNSGDHAGALRHLILRTAVMIRRREDASANTCELARVTGSNGWILKYLEQRDGEDVYQKDIEERLCTTRPTVSRVLTGMEAKGFLRRESVPGDARLKKLVLTEEGRRIDREIQAEMQALDDQIERGLTEEERATLGVLLKRVADNLSACDTMSET